MNIKHQQIEMGLGPTVAFRHRSRSRTRRERARWWFGQMRLVVDRAYDWSAAASPPADQPPLAGTRRP